MHDVERRALKPARWAVAIAFACLVTNAFSVAV